MIGRLAIDPRNLGSRVESREQALDPADLVERGLADGHQMLLVVADEEDLEPGSHRESFATDSHAIKRNSGSS